LDGDVQRAVTITPIGKPIRQKQTDKQLKKLINMKRIIIGSLALVCGLAVNGQGLLNVNTFGGGVTARVRVVDALVPTTSFYAGQPLNTVADLAKFPALDTSSTFHLGIYVGAVGTADKDLYLAKVANFASGSAAQYGYVLSSSGGGVIGVDFSSSGGPAIAGGSPAIAQIRGWSGNYASYEAAIAGQQAGAVVYLGQSASITTGNLGTPPNGTAAFLKTAAGASVAGFDLVPVPEPSVIALGLLGLGGLLCLRRRK